MISPEILDIDKHRPVVQLIDIISHRVIHQMRSRRIPPGHSGGRLMNTCSGFLLFHSDYVRHWDMWITRTTDVWVLRFILLMMLNQNSFTVSALNAFALFIYLFLLKFALSVLCWWHKKQSIIPDCLVLSFCFRPAFFCI